MEQCLAQHQADAGRLKHDDQENPRNVKRCNPTAIEADAGLLSCGFKFYCPESQNSELWGICTEVDITNYRRMEDEVTYDDYLFHGM